MALPFFAPIAGMPVDLYRDYWKHTWASFSRSLFNTLLGSDVAGLFESVDRTRVTLIHGRHDPIAPIEHVVMHEVRSAPFGQRARFPAAPAGCLPPRTTENGLYVAYPLLTLGPIRRGSLVRRFMPCGKPGCCCQASPPELHGPYYQWTRKVRGKTVTVRLTREEARLFEEWISNGRQLEKIVAQMEAVSLRITERLMKQRRKA